MEEESMVERKLNFFQKIRKNMYLRNMNTKKARKYRNLPDYLKNDKDVVDEILKLGDSWINAFSMEIQKELIKENNSRLKYVNNLRTVVTILNDEPSLVSNLDNYDNQLYNFLYEGKFGSNREFLKFLPLEKQMKILTEDIKFESDNFRKRRVSASKANDFLDKFSPEAFIRIAVEDKKENDVRTYIKQDRLKNVDLSKLTIETQIKLMMISDIYLKRVSDEALDKCPSEVFIRIAVEDKKENDYIKQDRLKNVDLSKLPIETQIKLMIISDIYLKRVSDEAKIKFVGNNPLLFEKLPSTILDKIVENDPNMFGKMPIKYQVEKTLKNSKLVNKSNFNLRSYNVGVDIQAFKTPEEVKKFISRSGISMLLDFRNMVNSRSYNFIWEMGKFMPFLIKLQEPAGDVRNFYLISRFIQRIKTYNNDGVLIQYLEERVRRDIPIYEKDIDKLNRIGKIISNDDMLKTLSQEEILDFAKNPSHEKLVSLIRKTYGDKAAQIVMDRNEITSELIPNYYIFSPQIIEEFGIGAVHSNLSFEMKSSGILSELARNPKKMQKFKIFNKATKDMFNDSAIDLENKLLNFYLLEDLMENIDFSKLSEKQKKNLQTLMMDRTGVREVDIIDIPKNSEELETYIERRNKLYDDAIQKENDVTKIKELISKRFFGLSYDLRRTAVLSAPSLVGMCKFYNLENFVNDPTTGKSQNFSEDELDLLEMLTIIQRISDIGVLKDFARELSKQENIVNPIFFKDLKEKVPMQYNQEMISSLMTPEKAEEMERQGVQGITTRVDEETGVKVISLAGADFKLYVTNPFLNNSDVRKVNGMGEAIDVWKNLENGISTFSGCLIDQGETKSAYVKGKIEFGFFNIRPEQVVAMGTTDIHVSHNKGELENSTDLSDAIGYDYPEEFMRKTTERLEYEDPYQDSSHPYNEVASLRTSKNISDIEENSHGGKIMPDYILVRGKATPELIKEINELGIKYVFELDEEKYIGKSWDRINKAKTEITPRPETERMKKLKEIASQDERE